MLGGASFVVEFVEVDTNLEIFIIIYLSLLAVERNIISL